MESVGWVKADRLEAGRHLLNSLGHSLVISSLEAVPGRVTTYDIGLEGVHGFFAAGTSDSFTLTHNVHLSVEPHGQYADFIPGSVPPTRYRKHHFFFDAWLAVHYDGLYRKGRQDGCFPTIHVTSAEHDAMHEFADDYFRKRFGVPSSGMANYWKYVSPEEMEKLAVGMAGRVGIPKSKSNEVLNKQNQWFFKKLNLVLGCLNRSK